MEASVYGQSGGQRSRRLLPFGVSPAPGDNPKGAVMASIRREILIEATSVAVWDAMRDVGALHTRLARGFITNCELINDVRTVTFANGLVAKEQIVTVDDHACRLVWSVVGGRLTHHNASTQVTRKADRLTQVTWVCDLLPDELSSTVAGMIEVGMKAMKATIEADNADA
jgi:Polyketide cyclase / dehydrase and lipid transport